MVQSAVIKYAIILAVLCGLIGGVWLKIHRLTSQRDEAVAQVADLTIKFQRSQQDLAEATRTKAELATAMQKAETARGAIQTQLQASLSKLRAQKPPQECQAAINWAVEQKLDLSWDKAGETK